jgi:hypothetical protein
MYVVRAARTPAGWPAAIPVGSFRRGGLVAEREAMAYAGATCERSARLESCDLAGSIRVLYSPAPDRPLHVFTVPVWLPDGRVCSASPIRLHQREMNLWSRTSTRTRNSGSPRRTQWQRLALVLPTAFSTNGKR